MEEARSEGNKNNLDPEDTITGTSQRVNTGGVTFGTGGVRIGQSNIVNVGGDVIGTLQGYTQEQVIDLINALREEEEVVSYSGRPPYLGLVPY